MAGEWIKIRKSLLTNPKLIALSQMVGEDREVGKLLSTGYNGPLQGIVTPTVTRYVTLVTLCNVWWAANEHTEDGTFHNSDLSIIDEIAGIPKFGEAMELVDWAIYDKENNNVTLPNFLEHNVPGKGGARSKGAERQARYRLKKQRHNDVTGDVTGDVTVTPREEKRRIYNNSTPNPPKGGSNVSVSKVSKPPKFDPKKLIFPEHVRYDGWEHDWVDYLTARKSKHGTHPTERAIKMLMNRTKAESWTPDIFKQLLHEGIEKKWMTLKREYLNGFGGYSAPIEQPRAHPPMIKHKPDPSAHLSAEQRRAIVEKAKEAK